ncbi:MAG: hypothetical protein IKT68_08485 [Clostridia bacterium]|nr:hypothetical protein [Clostridia bacterium]
MKRFLSYFMCIVLVVTACVYLPPEETTPTVSAAAYKDCGHHNFTRSSTDKILLCQPMATSANNLTDVSGNASSGFEAGPGLTINGSTKNQTARISVGGGYLTKLTYSSASTAQKAILDLWSAARGGGTGGVAATYMVSSEVHNNGWGYDIYMEWDTTIDVSPLSHIYLQFWLSDMGGLPTAASQLTNTKGQLWFNLIGTDSAGRTDGWNFPVYINQLAPDGSGYVNTAHYYNFPISSAHLKSGSLSKIKGLTIRYQSDGNGATKAPTIILGKFMVETPYDNIQTGGVFSDSSNTAYTSSNFPDPGTIGLIRIQGQDSYNLVSGVRYPMFPNGKGTFVVRLRYGNYTMDSPYFWPWRFKSNRSSGTISVSLYGGAYSTTWQRKNSKYLSGTYHTSYKYS